MVTFGDIRSIASRDPELAWRQLELALSAWEDRSELERVILPYLTDRVARWPDGGFERVTRDAWLEPIWEERAPHPMSALCDVLKIPAMRLYPQSLDALDAWGLLDVRSVRVEGAAAVPWVWREFGQREDVSARSLTLSSCGVTLHTLKPLLAGSLVRRLGAFSIETARVGEPGVEIIARCHGARFASLSLRSCALGAGALRALAGAAWWGGVEALDVSNAERVRGIDAFDNTLSIADVGVIADAGLRELRADRVALTDTLIERLAASGPGVERVSFRGCALRARHVEALVSRGFFERARAIDLRNNGISKAGLETLARQQMPELVELRLWPQRTTDARELEEVVAKSGWGDEAIASLRADIP